VSSRAALDAFAQALEFALTAVRRLVSEPSPEEWVDQHSSPLGRRAHCELARRGRLPSAHKVRGRWLVRRTDIDAFIEAHARAPSQSEPDAREVAEILNFAATRRRRQR
jgi:hypothetical protein